MIGRSIIVVAVASLLVATGSVTVSLNSPLILAGVASYAAALALLAHFGSAKAVSRANLADLKAVEGISANMAQTVYDYFHEKG